MVASGADQMVTLSPDRPLAEQRLVVHLAAESLPSDAQPDDAVLELVRVVADPGASAPDVDLTFIDDDTGAVVARVASVDNADGGVSYLPASIRLGCAVGEACDRAFRVVLSLPSNEIDGPVDVGWSVRAKVSSGSTGPVAPARRSRRDRRSRVSPRWSTTPTRSGRRPWRRVRRPARSSPAI